MKFFLKLILLAITTFSLFQERTALANEFFDTEVFTEYKVEEEGITHVTNTISIKNKNSKYFAKSYVFYLANVDPINIKAYEDGALLLVKNENTPENTKITVDFNEKSVGVNATKTFVVSYDTNKLSKKSGEIWEISIPKLVNPESYTNYKVSLNVPESFGEEAFISPEPVASDKKNERFYFNFNKEKISKNGVTAGFGRFQIFDFELKFRLENSDIRNNLYEIALPPDTSSQRVFYESIDPHPIDIKRSDNDNWLAKFDVKKEKNKEIVVKGKVQIFASPRNYTFSEPKPSDTAPTAYWQSDDPQIKEIASRLLGPHEIYKYVSESLLYNYEKFGQRYERKGALGALANPADSLCLEFTDLFIALARAKGIPAREVNGFAYSLNPTAEPLSLVNDKLHAWPEYWDETRKTWVPVDPTWASTTGGVDFFNKFDLRHFAFVFHNGSSNRPFSVGSGMDANLEEDIKVDFGIIPVVREPYIDLKYEYSKGFPTFWRNVKIYVENKGPSASYGFSPSIVFDDNLKTHYEKTTLLPFQKIEKKFDITYGLAGTKTPNSIKVVTDFAEMNVPDGKTQAILNQVLISSSLLFLVLTLFFLKFKKGFKANF